MVLHRFFVFPLLLFPQCCEVPLGLCGGALQLPITATEAGSGLVPPAVATALFGTPGSLMIAIMLFMAIISTGSAEAIAVSSLISYDIYKPYFNPKANGDDVIRVSRIVIPFYCVLAGALATVLWAIGIGLGWVYGFMGIHIGCAVSPLWFCLTDSRVSAKAAITAAWAGCISGYAAWIFTCLGLGDPLDRFGLGCPRRPALPATEAASLWKDWRWDL